MNKKSEFNKKAAAQAAVFILWELKKYKKTGSKFGAMRLDEAFYFFIKSLKYETQTPEPDGRLCSAILLQQYQDHNIQ